MNRTNFQWTSEFWQGWRESANPYRRYKSNRDRRVVVKSLALRERDRVLEVGCGYGWIAEALWGAADIEWTGIDLSFEMIQRMRSTHPERGQRTLLADGCRLPFKDGEFDKVVCTGVLMHIAEDSAAVRELIRVLRPGGLLLCSINNALSLYSLPVRLWNRRKKAFTQKFLIPWSFRRTLHDGGVIVESVAGDGIIATVPVSIGRICFPPVSVSSVLCRWDEWLVNRFAWVAYELWFRGVKSDPPCVS